MTGLSQYASELFGPRDAALEALPREAERQGLPAIHIPDEIGRLLQILIIGSGAKRILELGTLFGYSAVWMARVLPAGGTIDTLEAEPRHASVARANFAGLGVEDVVNIHEGPALETLQLLDGRRYDLIFIDADKVSYPRYLDWAIRLSHPGSLIVADNVWRQGSVVTGDDENGRAMAEFNRAVIANPRLVSTMIPTRDGADALLLATVRPI